MNRATLAVVAIAAAAALAGCSSTTKTNNLVPANIAASPTAGTASSSVSAAAPAAKVDAAAAVAAILKAVPTAKQGITITDANDRNHLLGRPGQYTSKITFTDSRVQGSDVDGLDPDDVERGGIVEVFPTAADAKTRADYIQGVVKSVPMLMEYDFPHGTVLVRVSRFLTASQAAEYDKAGAQFG